MSDRTEANITGTKFAIFCPIKKKVEQGRRPTRSRSHTRVKRHKCPPDFHHQKLMKRGNGYQILLLLSIRDFLEGMAFKVSVSDSI